MMDDSGDPNSNISGQTFGNTGVATTSDPGSGSVMSSDMSPASQVAQSSSFQATTSSTQDTTMPTGVTGDTMVNTPPMDNQISNPTSTADTTPMMGAGVLGSDNTTQQVPPQSDLSSGFGQTSVPDNQPAQDGLNNMSSNTTPPSMDTAASNPLASSMNMGAATDVAQPQTPETSFSLPSQEPASTPAVSNEPVQQSTPQMSSPMDPPPPPATSVTPQVGGNLNDVINSEKPKKKFPILLVLLILIVLVFGAVGYLAYTNFVLKNEAEPAPTTTKQAILPTQAPKAEENYKAVQSTLLPLTFMVPTNWNVEETENEELANQKMILVQSPDFAYEGSEIASGYEFRIGPVNDLSKKYDTFESFEAEENAEGDFNKVTYNQITWLKKTTSAKTIIDTNPVTVTMYSNPTQAADALLMFNKILESIKLTASGDSMMMEETSSTPTTTPSGATTVTPTATTTPAQNTP